MKTILVVEDEPNQCELYLEELTDKGYQVECARSGIDALRRAHSLQPDLVVLDLNLPGMSGLEFLARIRTERPELPVIIHTAYSSYRDEFMSWAADGYVLKSSDLSELKERIKRALCNPFATSSQTPCLPSELPAIK